MDDTPEPIELLGYPAFGFADPGPLREELTGLVLAGHKVATASLVVDYVIDGVPVPRPGDRSIVFDSERRPVALIETTRVELKTMSSVKDDFAQAEGEGYADAGAWRVSHERYWGSHLDAYRRDLGDPGFQLSESTAVVCEWFRLVALVDPISGALGGPAWSPRTARVVDLDPTDRAFLAAARTATLATIAPDGRPRLVPICFVVSPDGPDGRPRLHSPLDDKPKRGDDPHDLARVRDLLVLPNATLLVDRWSEDWDRLAWLRLETRAELLEPEPRERAEHEAAVVALRTKYPQYATHRLEDRPILRFTVIRAVAWGDLGAS